MLHFDSEKIYLFYGEVSALFDKNLEFSLSISEQLTANRIKNEEKRKSFITCRFYLNHLLSIYLAIETDQINLSYGVNGKPYLESHECHFSISHAQRIFMIAMSKLGSIGIDIERKDRPIDYEKLVDFLFSDTEKSSFESLNLCDRPAAFLNSWTRKEAFFKAKGSGLAAPIKELKVNFDLASEPKILATEWSNQEKKEWVLLNVRDIENYIGAMAIRTDEKNPIVESIRLTGQKNKELMPA